MKHPSALSEQELKDGDYPKKWLKNFLFMKRVMKELHEGGFCLLGVRWATSKGIWCQGSYHCMSDNGYYTGYADFKVFYRHNQKPVGLNATDTNWRLMWDGPISRRLAKRHDLVAFVDDSIMYAMGRVRELEAAEAKTAHLQ